ncbi:sterol desaturase family protein [Leeia sp.]|uniref:sterol desaturase family protein n=1 Tax=Leeia sp. TaxID=2884678 RepID=UPI0035B31A6E
MPYQEQFLPAVLIVLSTSVFLVVERVAPGRALPNARGWYWRAGWMNLLQLGLIGLGGLTWNRYFRGHALLQIGGWSNPVLEGLFYWFVGTFVFYWWHRLRHARGFWLLFHQIHHSPSRIEVLTSFYKHPLEIAADSILTGLLIYCVMGGTAEAGAWTSLFGATGEYFYHANIRTPKWLGYLIQRPEHHAIHHQLDVHHYNYGDLTLWDRLFGTFKEAEDFVPACGFPGNGEARLADMLRFRDVYAASAQLETPPPLDPQPQHGE